MKILGIGTALVLLLLSAFLQPVGVSANDPESLLAGDALKAPPRPQTLAASGSTSPSRYQPSAFLAGRVAVQLIFVESDGTLEPSTTDWTKTQVAQITDAVNTALHWWGDRLPNARLSFDLTEQVVSSRYEPITHGLSTESQWIGDAFSHMGISAANYFDQAYTAADNLRHARHADWATTIFVANSSGKGDGSFADGHFAYAYINGPFMVITSDAGPYGASRLAPVVTHEFGHIFGALDQYASAGTPCTQLSGYLSVPTTNSQANSCGTRLVCIMLEPLEAYAADQVDPSALGQIGYRDSNNNNIPDPLDTAPILQLQMSQQGGGRPVFSGQAVDQPFPSPTGESITINTITRIEYRADGGAWNVLPPQDGAYDSSGETINTMLPLYDGAHTVELRALNSVGASSTVARYNISVSGIGADPHYELSVPNVSNKSTITIGLVAPTGTAVQMSANQFFNGATWSPAQPSMTWPIGDAEGQRTLYIRFRDKNGIESPTFARTILVDRTPPTGRALLHIKPTTWLEILASDTATPIDAMQLSFDNGVSGDWQPFQPTMPLTLQATKITIRLRDEAGNISPPIAATSINTVWLPLLRS